jgi:hypothetical protein
MTLTPDRRSEKIVNDLGPPKNQKMDIVMP